MSLNTLARLMSRRRIDGDCWLYSGSISPDGYGSIRADGRTRRTHRVSYELHVGPIPEGLDLDHLCRNRACFNPAHLEPVTRAENLRRGLCGTHNAVKTHCPHGHPYSPENTYIVPAKRALGGYYEGRACLTCRRARYHAKRAAA